MGVTTRKRQQEGSPPPQSPRIPATRGGSVKDLY